MPSRSRLPRLPDLTPPGDARRGYAQHEILAEVRRLILNGNLPPGTGLPLREFARVFAVSAIPVRESLQTLIGEGLVEHRPNFGYTVTRLTAAELRELYVARERLESAALAAAVTRAGPEDHRLATESHARLERAVLDDDPAAYHRETRTFHLALVRPSGMARLVHMLEYAWNITEPVQPMVHVSAAERAVLHADHSRQLAAFLAGDAGALLAATDRHHARLNQVVAGLPTDLGLFAEPAAPAAEDI
ncbi:GntR family transcriptional regulator [Nocardia terpenica]|uniref:GntR family transcriptional regulator n=1 Tax=Nocardia terpenica TaxID=455432 RepID=UPI0018953CB0|nr:GntR family transcriptional regulator [Nocardia terpenica]MBF6107975.1 GntR family transcriptional regulator [Nocardia terpenica]MBF6115494.1 GntR family transcriptional regulator [Nocardia terpenica]MBF6121931.1 GntR family transcriptional regulator [Nocardia terpenica]MBF6155525.1 GntR family transcriptional regulator [Nocardia terpenica]